MSGLSANHTKEFELDDLSAQHFLVIAIEAAKKLNWKLSLINDDGFVAYTSFSFSSWGEVVNLKIDNTKAVIKSQCLDCQLFDWGKNKRNIARFLSVFHQLKPTFSDETLEHQYKELKSGFSASKETTRQPSVQVEKKGFLSLFKPKQGYFITPIIIDLNILIFILMAMSGASIMLPDVQSLLMWGANFRPVTMDGGWWRLLSNCFIHIGIFHLLMNMYALLYIGILLEPYLGRIRFATGYLLTGIAASVSSLWWNEMTISAGASGAIFGMYGIFLGMLSTNLIEKTARKALFTSIIIFVLYNLLNGLRGQIDNAAHVGGLISGIVIGFSFVPGLRKPDDFKLKYILTSVISGCILSASVAVCYTVRPFEIKKYDQKMQDFYSMEAMALEMYRIIPLNAPREKLLDEISMRSLYYWQKNIDLLNQLDSLYLPDQIHGRNRRLIYYCELRIKDCNLIYKAVKENTDLYSRQIEELDKQIEKIVSELTGRE